MQISEIEQRISEELNNPELIEKFILLAKEKGFRYRSLDFTNVQVLEDKVCITMESK